MRNAIIWEQISANRCPVTTHNYQRDGQMRVDGNGGSDPNYFPNSFDAIKIDQAYKEPLMEIFSDFADWYDRNCKKKMIIVRNGEIYLKS